MGLDWSSVILSVVICRCTQRNWKILHQKIFKKAKDEMCRWEELQSLLISQFSNASSIIQSLPVLRDSKNYGALLCIGGIENVLAKQMECLEDVLRLMNRTMEGFRGVVISLEKMVRDSKQLNGVGSAQLSDKQLRQQIGIKPSLAYCLDGLKQLEDMHRSEYLLKLTLVAKLQDFALKESATGDFSVLHQLLVDQPNIPQDEVRSIYDIVFAEEIAC